jgi:hypothetical protein
MPEIQRLRGMSLKGLGSPAEEVESTFRAALAIAVKRARRIDYTFSSSAWTHPPAPLIAAYPPAPTRGVRTRFTAARP